MSTSSPAENTISGLDGTVVAVGTGVGVTIGARVGDCVGNGAVGLRLTLLDGYCCKHARVNFAKQLERASRIECVIESAAVSQSRTPELTADCWWCAVSHPVCNSVRSIVGIGPRNRVSDRDRQVRKSETCDVC